MPSAAPRILILSASVGAGHLRAAQAVELWLKQLAPDAFVRNLDVLTLTNALFRRVYATAYLDLVNRAPHLIGYFYDLTDSARVRGKRSERLHMLSQRLNLGKLMNLIESQPWDMVINTHFLPADIIAGLRRRTKLPLQHITVVTDFDAHAFWVNQPTDHYFTATRDALLSLSHWGVPQSTITVSGIPIHPVFSLAKTREACIRKHSLTGKGPIILMLAGGFGVGPVERIFEQIRQLPSPARLVVVCGKNESLRKRLLAAPLPSRHTRHILGYTTDMDELLAACDCVITKPGGLTTSEVLARGAAMIIMNPIPGQENRNSDYLLEQGAAIKINSLATLTEKVAALLDDAPRLERMRHKAMSLGTPNAGETVARAVLEMIGSPHAP